MAIAPATLNIRPQRRADYPLAITFKDSTGTPINLTGWEVIAQVWDKNRTTKIGDWEVEIVSASTGEVALKLPYAVTEVLPSEAYYDVMLIDTSGLREYYLEGIARPSQGYTSPT
jgi:hypothetical protein